MENGLNGLTKEELSAKGLKPCPRCGAFYDPNDLTEKTLKCSLCKTDLTLSPEEVRTSLLSNDELAKKLKKVNKKARRLKRLTTALFLICILFLPFIWKFSACLLVLGLIFTFISAKAKTNAKKMLADNITRDIISEVIDEAVYSMNSRLPNETLKEADVPYCWDRADGTDIISGKYRGHVITFCDITLEEESESTDMDGDTSTSYYPVFTGQWIICELGREVPAKLRLYENSEKSLKKKKKKSAKSAEENDIKTADEEFNKRFKILAEDQYTALQILTPSFMNSIMTMDDLSNSRIYFCFTEKRVHILLDTKKDLFELKKKDGENVSEIRERMRDELRVITNILDELFRNDWLFET